MGRMKESPKYNVISFRVTDDEKKHLETLKAATGANMNDLIHTLIFKGESQ